MTIKSHIAISATISMALITLVACQQKPLAAKDGKDLSDHLNNLAVKAETKAKEIEKGNELVKSDIMKDEQLRKSTVQNLLNNGNFNEGISKWSYDTNVSFLSDEGRNFVKIVGKPKVQSRLWQFVNTESGHVYRLSFQLKTENVKGYAFAIFRDNENRLEQYLDTKPSDDWKEFSKEFKSLKNGKYMICLSCTHEGIYMFSDVLFIDVTE